MKKILKFLLIIVFIFPIIVKANMFKVPDTDIVINIDEDLSELLDEFRFSFE